MKLPDFSELKSKFKFKKANIKKPKLKKPSFKFKLNINLSFLNFLNPLLDKIEEQLQNKRNIMLLYLSIFIGGIVIFYNLLLPFHKKYFKLKHKLNSLVFHKDTMLENRINMVKFKKKKLKKEIVSIKEDLRYLNILLSMSKKIHCTEKCQFDFSKKILFYNKKNKLHTSFFLKSEPYSIDTNISVKRFIIRGENKNNFLYKKMVGHQLKYNHFFRLVDFIKDVESFPYIVTFEDFNMTMHKKRELKKGKEGEEDKNITKYYLDYEFDINIWSVK